MGKPIAGENKFPFQNGGFLVDSAKIDGQTFSKELFIYKQTSSFIFDLIEGTTGEIFRDVRIAWVDENGFKLNYDDTPLYIASILPERTFARKVQSVRRNIYGFLVMIHENKVKVSTGDYIFYDKDVDQKLTGVALSPQTIVIKEGETAAFDVKFFPENYENQKGNWSIRDPRIVEPMVQTALNPRMSFRGMEVGDTPIFFIPEANNTIVAAGHIYVIPKDHVQPHLKSMAVRPLMLKQPNPHPIDALDPALFVGDEVSFKIVLTPSDYVLTKAPTIHTDRYLEYVGGSDDFLTHKFKVVAEPVAGVARLDFQIVTPEATHTEYTRVNVYASDYTAFGLGIPLGCRIGQTIYANAPCSPYSLEWSSTNESVLSVVEAGAFKGLKEGRATIIASTPSGATMRAEVQVSDRCALSVTVDQGARGTMALGQTTQLSLVVDPPECAQYYVPEWQLQDTNRESSVATISEGGLMDVGHPVNFSPNSLATLYAFPSPLNKLPQVAGIQSGNNYVNGDYGFGPSVGLYVQRDYGTVTGTVSTLTSTIYKIYIEVGSTRSIHITPRRGNGGSAGMGGIAGEDISMSYVVDGDIAAFDAKPALAWEMTRAIENSFLYVTGISEGRGTITFKMNNMPNVKEVIIDVIVFEK